MQIVTRFGRRIHHRSRRKALLRALPVNAICAEVGVWKGDFSEMILRISRPRELHLIDPWGFNPDFPNRWWGGSGASSQSAMDTICARVHERFREVPAVQIHRIESAGCDVRFPDEYFDWVYIDADHSYAAVLADLRLFFKKVKPDGYIAGDDFLWGRKDGYPVLRAVAEGVRTCPMDLLWISGGQYLLQKRSVSEPPHDSPAEATRVQHTPASLTA